MENEGVFERLRAFCPSGLVTRSEIKELTGGFLTTQTIAILDSMGQGIPNRKLIGSKIVYSIDDVIEWLQNNTELINFEQ